MTPHKFRLFAKKWARLFHIYISMLGLVLIVFFAVTGFFLNHPDAFGLGKMSTRHQSGTITTNLLSKPFDQAAIVKKLRSDFGVRGEVGSFEEERTEIRVAFKGPGTSVDVVIREKDGHCEVTSEARGVLGRIGELHRGTDAGPGWRWLIDATAVLTMFVAASGVILWLIVPKWRRWGIAALLVSVVVCGLVYWMLVP